MKSISLSAYSMNITSQFGEDGIIAEIFSRIGMRNRYCVEFGAWDGMHLSNTWNLWRNQGWRSLLIEGDAQRCHALNEGLKDFPNVESVNSFVTPEGENSLNRILASAKAPEEIDLMSIDIDGDEYYVWQHLTLFRPRVVVVEYNPTIPPELDLVQLPGAYFGASASALVRLAHGKGYGLACLTETNCIFVANAYFHALGIAEPHLESVFPRGNLTYVINAYDGVMYLNRNPTYSPKIARLGISRLSAELKSALQSSAPQKKREDLPPGLLEPVRIFSLPSDDGPWTLRERLVIWARSQWLQFRSRLTRQVKESPPARRWTRIWTIPRANKRLIREWRAAGSPSPPPHALKQSILRRHANRHRTRVLVETGTYLGDMVEAMRNHFDRVFSIELSPELSRRARERFSGDSRVTILQGNSAAVLPNVLKNLNEPALFWLDGHFSAGITAKGEEDTPILSEVDSILRHAIKRHVLLVDDARSFNGTGDYPTLAEFEAFVRARRPDASFTVQDDIIRIT